MQTLGDQKSVPVAEKANKNVSLDLVYCDNCSMHRSSCQAVGVKFYLCSCRHVMCLKCVQQSQTKQAVCMTCKKAVQACEINDKLPEEFKSFFDPNYVENCIAKYTQQLTRISNFRELRLAKLIRKPTELTGIRNGAASTNVGLEKVIQQQQESISQLKAQMKKLQEEKSILAEQRDGLANELEKSNAQSKKLLKKYSQASEKYQMLENHLSSAKAESVCSGSSGNRSLCHILPQIKQANQTPTHRISMGPVKAYPSVGHSIPGFAAKGATGSKVAYDPRFTFSSKPLSKQM